MKEYANFRTSNIERVKLETTASMINGVSYQIADEESLAHVRSELKKHLQISKADDIESSSQSITMRYTSD